MAEVIKPNEKPAPPQLPRTVSALRSRPAPKRVPTRVSIAEPKDSTHSDLTTLSSRGAVSSKLNVTSTPWSAKLILTLDGGGIRGYSSLVILRALMNEITRIEQTLEPVALSSAHTTRIPREDIPAEVYREGRYLPCHYFDYVAGTSVGGLIAIMLGMLGKSVDECIVEFQRQNKAIPLADDLVDGIELALLNRRTTWPTKRTRAFFDTFSKFSVTSTAKKHTTATTTATAAAAPINTSAGGSASAPTTPSRAQFQREDSSSLNSSNSSVEFRKDSFQCQTLAWCTEVEEELVPISTDTKRSTSTASTTSSRSSTKTKKTSRHHPYAFCTYQEHDEDSDSEQNNETGSIISIPEVAKAITTPSSATFKPFKLGSGQFVDGSKLIRDPTLEVLKEISSLLGVTESTAQSEPVIDLLLSLGTDEHHTWFYEKLIHQKPSPQSSRSSTEYTSREDISKEEGKLYREYHRFEVKDIKLGLLTRKKYYLREIEEATERWLNTDHQREKITRYAQMLVEKRRARAQTDRWETFALGVRYACFHEGCRKTTQRRGEEDGGSRPGTNSNVDEREERIFDTRGSFYDHLERRHGLLKMAARDTAFNIEDELDKGRRFACT